MKLRYMSVLLLKMSYFYTTYYTGGIAYSYRIGRNVMSNH